MGEHGESGDDEDPSDEGGTHRATWSVGQPDSVSSTMVRTVAEAEGVAPTDLPRPLQDTVNVDALIGLLESGTGTGDIEVSFTYVGWEVTVSDDGTVIVERAGE